MYRTEYIGRRQKLVPLTAERNPRQRAMGVRFLRRGAARGEA